MRPHTLPPEAQCLVVTTLSRGELLPPPPSSLGHPYPLPPFRRISRIPRTSQRKKLGLGRSEQVQKSRDNRTKESKSLRKLGKAALRKLKGPTWPVQVAGGVSMRSPMDPEKQFHSAMAGMPVQALVARRSGRYPSLSTSLICHAGQAAVDLLSSGI